MLFRSSKLDAKEGYLFHVIQISSNSSDFIPSLIEHILDMDYKDKDYKKLFAQRKEMLKSLNLEKLSSNFWKKYNQLSYEERLYRLTDSTTGEKNEFISLLSKIDISAKNKEIINRAYQDLYAYLNDFIFVDNNLTQYFSEYKVFKLINSYFEGDVVSTKSRVGGIVGFNHNGLVSGSYSKGSVKGYREVGGLVGYNWTSDTLNSYSTASVEGTQRVGGLVGENFENSSITLSRPSRFKIILSDLDNLKFPK